MKQWSRSIFVDFAIIISSLHSISHSNMNSNLRDIIHVLKLAKINIYDIIYQLSKFFHFIKPAYLAQKVAVPFTNKWFIQSHPSHPIPHTIDQACRPPYPQCLPRASFITIHCPVWCVQWIPLPLQPLGHPCTWVVVILNVSRTRRLLTLREIGTLDVPLVPWLFESGLFHILYQI